MTDHAAVIAGGGPTGLMLAGELALAGVDAVIVERREDQELDGLAPVGCTPHARGARSARHRRPLHRRGTDRGGDGLRHEHARHQRLPDAPRLSANPAAEAVRADPRGVGRRAGCDDHPGRDVVGLAQDDTGVDVELSDGTSLRARLPRRLRRRPQRRAQSGGIDFPGLAPMTSWIIAEVTMDGEPELGPRRDHRGLHGLHQMGEGGPVRVLLIEPDVEQTGTPPWTSCATRSLACTDRISVCARRELDLAIHRFGASSRDLPQGTRFARRRRRGHPPSRRGPRPQHRRARRREPGHGSWHKSSTARHPTVCSNVPRRTAPGRRACCATPRRRSRSADLTSGTTRCARSSPRC